MFLIYPIIIRFRHCVDLLGFLDFEIWKASHMLAHGLPEEKSSNKEDSKNRIWDDFERN